MNKRRLTNEEKRDWLLENCQNENGNLVIRDIDLSDFKGKVILNGWKVGGSADLSFWKVKGNLFQRLQTVGENLDQSCQSAKNLYQGCQKVNGDLYQDCQKVNGDLYQNWQIVNGNLEQDYQNVGKDLISQKLKEDEEWVDCWRGVDYSVIRSKKLKEISLDELAKMGYKLKEK